MSEAAAPNAGYVLPDEQKRQREYTELVRTLLAVRWPQGTPNALVHTFGCQGNVADGERIEGMLEAMGFAFTDRVEEADLVLYNTCAVRAHAEDRVFGNVGALKRFKQNKPEALVVLCGCMMQQQWVADKIYKSYPFVDLVFGTHVLHRLPEFLFRVLSSGRRVFELPESNGELIEGLPVRRAGGTRAFLPVMYGCDNFCSYCIVPYVRGRERSRAPEDVLREARRLVEAGYKDITLLGQNVNSYGKGLDGGPDFPWLLREINQIPGDFRIRFMTSHPKDCTHALLDAMASCDKVAKHLHLPFQSGNDEILRAMNRRYTSEQYLELTDYARRVMPELSITSDVIVGFPGETYAQFRDTMRLAEQVRFTSLFTFIFSPREGTPAAKLPDPVMHAQKVAWFQELTALQESIAARRTAAMKGKVYRVLVEEPGKSGDGYMAGRTEGNHIIEFPASPECAGSFCEVRVTKPKTWLLEGELVTDS